MRAAQKGDRKVSKGRFGIHGGQYIPETLMNAVTELEEAYDHYKKDPQFNAELTQLYNENGKRQKSSQNYLLKTGGKYDFQDP